MSAARVLPAPLSVGTPEERQLARKLADSALRRLPKSVLREDVHQAALIGLWDGIRKCNAEVTPEQRKGYLITRIRGQIIDELRAQDWLPRRARQCEGPSAPAPVIVRFGDLGGQVGDRPWLELQPAETVSPDHGLEVQAEIDEAMGAPLTARHRHVLQRHYWQGLRFIDIAHELGVSEPRVSQFHAQAILTLRAWQTGALPEPRGAVATWDGMKIRREARLVIERKHRESHDHRAADRRTGGAPDASPSASPFPCAVPVRWVGGSPAAATRRPVPRGAGRPELGREAWAPLCDARPEPIATGAAAETGGGLAVSAAATAPVPSVLPEEGFNLHEALAAYRNWMIDQAMVRANSNVTHAAKLLGWTRTGLVMALQTRGEQFPKRRPGRKPDAERAVASSPETSPPPEPAPEPSRPGGLAARIDWVQVASWREHGLSDARIAQKLAGPLCAHKFTIEKVLTQPRPLAKCGP